MEKRLNRPKEGGSRDHFVVLYEHLGRGGDCFLCPNISQNETKASSVVSYDFSSGLMALYSSSSDTLGSRSFQRLGLQYFDICRGKEGRGEAGFKWS